MGQTIHPETLLRLSTRIIRYYHPIRDRYVVTIVFTDSVLCEYRYASMQLAALYSKYTYMYMLHVLLCNNYVITT